MRKIVTKEDAVTQLFEGVETLYDVVSSTMGPRGKNVFFPPNKITHDGVTAAKQVILEDVPAIGANLIKEASKHMDNEIGDGTTTTTVLTHAIVKEGMKYEPMQLRKDLEAFLPNLLTQLDTMKSKSPDDALNAASVAAGDPNLGKQAADLIEEIGIEGAVSIELGELETEIELVPGFVVPFTYMTPSESVKPKIELDNPAIAVFDKTVSTNDEALHLMKTAQKNGHTTLVLFAPNVQGDALQTFFENTMRGNMTILCVKATKRYFPDIALFTGAETTSDYRYMKKWNWSKANKVISDANETTIIGSYGDENKIKEAVERYKKDDEHRRAAELQGKSAVIRVGGYTEVEKEEKYYRIEDAIGSARAAIKDGVLPGAGKALASLNLESVKGDAKDVLKVALKAPFKKLMENSGLDEKLGHVNVLTGKPDDSIVDPVVLTKEALSSAISVGSNILTAGAVVVEVKDDSTSK